MSAPRRDFGDDPAQQPARALSNSFGLDGAMSSRNTDPQGQGAGNTDAQSNLLGLLKFSSPAPSQMTPQNAQATEHNRSVHNAHRTQNDHERAISASDLVASLRGSGSRNQTPTAPAQPLPRPAASSHQESLLKLLNQTASAAEEVKLSSLAGGQAPTRDTPSPARQSPPVRVFGSKEATPTPFQPAAIKTESTSGPDPPVFTYINPFEQLSASSPLKSQTRTKNDGEIPRHHLKSPSPANAHASSRRKLTNSGNEVLQSIETPGPEPSKDGRSEVEALKGIGAPSKDTETVAEALNEVGDQVHKQMEHALAEAENNQSHLKKAKAKRSADDASLPARNTHETQSADADETAEVKDLGILTYQIPMRPFVHIEIKKEEEGIPLRDDCIVNIARFKKEFDQVDRTLATASKDFIVYGMAKNGGIRVIQQENGVSSLLFPNTQDRIFNVAISSAPARPGLQCVIGTGVSGTVYWTTIADSSGELNETDMEAQSLVIPPTLGGSESVSNGQLKTRAKRSNRHPDFFAIGRGKSIQIVLPMHARKSQFLGKEATLDSENYFADRSLKVITGKAGKDFAFSEDDTVIATLDKAGKLRLWDIRDLIHPDNADASILAPVDVKTPILTFSTSNSSEKTSPTSVLFVDKIRSYQKGIAQRYIIVGMKQNHTLQLWDLCLQKAVQEISFPHENESDAVCSVAYHPLSSIIVVGHPTRNSVYIIQLSAPKFHLPSSLSQARLASRLANNDSTLPKTEATAIMSNFREYSLSNVGQLRSLDLAPPSGETPKLPETDEDPQLFDLYVMHSKGVTCLGFRKEDLGWSAVCKTLHPVDAQEGGYVTIKDLRETPTPSVSDLTSANGDGPSATPSKASLRGVKDVEKLDRKAAASATKKPVEKIEKRKPKQNTVNESVSKTLTSSSQPTIMTPNNSPPRLQATPNGAKEVSSPQVQKSVAPSNVEETAAPTNDVKPSEGQSTHLGISRDLLDQEMKKIEQAVSAEFNTSFQRELDALHRRLDKDKQVQNATTGANQEAILRLVSKQLGDNVERSLASIVLKSIRESVTPSISDVASNVLEKHLPNVLGQQMEHLLPLHLKALLPEAIGLVMQTKEMHRTISDQITSGISGHLEREIMGTLQNSIIPKVQNIATSTAQKTSEDTENRIRAQLQQAELQRRDDSAKIDRLSNSVRVLTETIQQMAAAQSDFQSEVLRLQQKALQDGHALARQASPTPSESASMHINPEQQEVEAVSALMQKGNYEEATIMWLQSGQQLALFDQVFVRYDPGYIRHISPLVVLSVGAAITTSFETSLQQRLTWTETVLSCIEPNHPEIHQVVRKVMDFVSQRLSNVYMQIAEEQPNNPALRQIAHLTRRSKELMARSPSPTE